MARGRRTALPKAATAKAMSEMGFQTGEIAGAIGLPEGTVDDIVNGRHAWGKMLQNPVFNEYRVQQKRLMQTASVELAKKALKQVELRLPQASAAQAVMIYGVLRDKERLDAGEPTEIIATYNVHAVQGLDRLARLLSHSLLPNDENPS